MIGRYAWYPTPFAWNQNGDIRSYVLSPSHWPPRPVTLWFPLNQANHKLLLFRSLWLGSGGTWPGAYMPHGCGGANHRPPPAGDATTALPELVLFPGWAGLSRRPAETLA